MTRNDHTAIPADLDTPGQGLAVIDHRALFRTGGMHDVDHFGRVMAIGDTTSYNLDPKPHQPTDWHILTWGVSLMEAMNMMYQPLMGFVADHMLGYIRGNVCFIGADAEAESFTIGHSWADRQARFFVYAMEYIANPHGDPSFLDDMPLFEAMCTCYSGDRDAIKAVMARVLDSMPQSTEKLVLIQPEATPDGFTATLFPVNTPTTA